MAGFEAISAITSHKTQKPSENAHVGGAYMAYGNQDADLFKAKEHHVDLSGVSAFCHPGVMS